jgi:hypothetical protein
VHDIAVDNSGWIYIADRENRRIQVFSPEGRFEAQWVNLSRAAAVHISKGENQLVYVGEYFAADPEACKTAMRLGPRVSILETSGKLLARLGEHPSGDEPGRFYAPHAVATDSRGDIYVAEVSFAEWHHLQKDPAKELRSMQKLVKRQNS